MQPKIQSFTRYILEEPAGTGYEANRAMHNFSVTYETMNIVITQAFLHRLDRVLFQHKLIAIALQKLVGHVNQTWVI